ncbi:glycosyltransferase family 4 protein [Sulfurimonas sp.]|uniref:glycosyltransferase family 4 protein n=1 Tax=Sulfurimonas sp. TaxID=2022749 RepID=UPI003D0ADD94
MKNIYFNIRANSRERMWDTPKNAHPVCNVLLPKGIEQQSSIKTYNNTSSFISKLKLEVSKKLINQQKVDNQIALQADCLYMWGAFPKDDKKPFILELDNPYTPAYYHIDNFKRNKQKIKDKLLKAQKITFMSNTCKNHAIELYGKEIEKKSFLNYPYMSDNIIKRKVKEDDIIDFVFVGFDYRRKGGSELLKAFSKVSAKNIRLTFISNIEDNIIHEYEDDTRIIFLPPQSRETLFDEIYPKSDVLILPSLHESFGVVLLEALSFGLGLICIDTYATSEIVENNFNGKLLHHPILKPTLLNGEKVINCVDIRIKDFSKQYLENDQFYYGMYKELINSIEEAIVNFKSWQENSVKLFHKRFAPDIWLENFENIIK